MTMRRRVSASVLALLLFLLPVSALAAPILPTSIIPSQCQDCPAAWKCVLATFDNVVAFALAIAFMIATLLFAWAGFLWVMNPTSPENRKKGRTILWHTVIGLIITLAAWLIVNTVLAVLTGTTIGSATSVLEDRGNGSWCIEQKQVDITTLGSGTTTAITATLQKEQTVRTQLQNAGLSVNKGACPANTRYQDVPSGCTTVGGLRPATISQATILKQLSNTQASITVTGGNELGHASGEKSHGTGYKIDLGLGNAELNALLKGLPKAGTRGGDSNSAELYKDRCGNIYALESTHWDILVLGVCTPLTN